MLVIKMIPDKKKGPIYLQLYEYIRNMIIEGTIKAGESLPSKRALATHMDVSVKTIENAYYQLMIEGYISSREKSGYYVNRVDNYMEGKTKPEKFETRYKRKVYKVDFITNQTPMEMFPRSVWYRYIRETLSENPDALFETVPFNGLFQLRKAISEYLWAIRGIEASPDQIVVGSGTEFLYARLLQLLSDKGAIALEDPGYAYIKRICDAHKAAYVPIPVNESEGINMDKLRESKAKYVHISPAHHFPLGFVTPISKRVELLEWSREEEGRYIIEDDYNSEYRYHGKPIPTMYAIARTPKIIYINTFSKTVMPSLRIGYMILPPELMTRYGENMKGYTCTVDALSQLTLAKFIENGHLERFINRIRKLNIENRDIVAKAVDSCDYKDRLELIGDLAGTHFLLKVNTEKTDKEIIAELLKADILMSSVMEYMHSEDEHYRSLLIINYSSVTKEKMDYFLKVLKDII